MGFLSRFYYNLPSGVRSIVGPRYRQIRGISSAEERHEQFVDTFFEEREYARYVREFDNGPVSELRDEALEELQEMTGSGGLGSIGLDFGRECYALLRKRRPETVVETGVCNGVSTLCLLLALHQNGHGTLHSIDFPFYADESLAEFKRVTFDEYGGAAIPSDKSPGWIVPDRLEDRWSLTIGKSQRELPDVLQETGGIDVFLHDSEHSIPCMFFEYELAYEWLEPGGVLLSDDITWNDAFETFASTRDVQSMRITNNTGIMRKSQ